MQTVMLTPGAVATLPETAVREQPGEDLLGRDLPLGDRAGCVAVVSVVPVDCFEGRGGLLEGFEGEQSLSGRIVPAPSGVLYDHGLAEGEIHGAAAAEPAGAQRDVDVLADAPLAPGPGEVRPVGLHGRRPLRRAHHVPSVLAQAVERSRARDRHLERRPPAPWQIEEPGELEVL